MVLASGSKTSTFVQNNADSEALYDNPQEPTFDIFEVSLPGIIRRGFPFNSQS
jgi:hypothetical protein